MNQLDENDIDVAALVNKVPIDFGKISSEFVEEVEDYCMYRVK